MVHLVRLHIECLPYLNVLINAFHVLVYLMLHKSECCQPLLYSKDFQPLLANDVVILVVTMKFIYQLLIRVPN